MSAQMTSQFAKWGFLPLRLVVAVVFLMHGGQKVLYFGVSGVADMLTKLGFPLAAFFAVVLMTIELAGGLAILFGFLTRAAGFILAIEMAIAIYVARLGGGFFSRKSRSTAACNTVESVLQTPRIVASVLPFRLRSDKSDSMRARFNSHSCIGPRTGKTYLSS